MPLQLRRKKDKSKVVALEEKPVTVFGRDEIQNITQACQDNDVKRLQDLIGDVNPNLRRFAKMRYHSFADLAAKAGSLEALEFLLRIGCHIDPPATKLEVKEWPSRTKRVKRVRASSITGSPLTKGAQGGHLHVVEWLVKVAGVEPTTEGLGEASSRGYSKIVHFLLQQGCDPNGEQRKTWRSPLHVACFSGRTECAKLLVKHGAFINGKDGGGMTSLMLAVKFGTEELVAFLLAHGADISVKDKFGKTVLDDCSEERRLWLLGCGPPALMYLAGHAIAVHGMDYSSLPPYLRVFMKRIIGSKYA